ncbi:hypothetical protein BS78_06G077500 [Paspalum vaginatum]|nr:hypothetical protein BS78_06G077500 [Paspalum vaginatum]
MPTLIITVDLECCRCSNKIQKILCCIQDCGEFVIEKVVYEKDKVMVSGPFDAIKLSAVLWCKAGRVIKNIEEAKPPKPKPKPEPAPCKLMYAYPYPYPCPQTPGASWSWPCSCPTPHCGCQWSKPAPAPAPAPAPPPPEPLKTPECKCPTWSPSCYCGGGYPPYMMPPHMPYPYPVVVCDDSNPPACAIM